MSSLAKVTLTVSYLVIANTNIAYAQSASIRSNVKIHIDARLLKANSTNFVETDILYVLKYNHIYVDERSKIQIQTEGNDLDLSCFDCILHRVGIDAYEHSSDNKEVFKP